MTSIHPSQNELPHHVAVIMDGNGRWAQKRQLPRALGHKAGLKTATQLVQWCSQSSIKILTLFAFSTENWNRPQQELQNLSQLFQQAFALELKTLITLNIQLRIIGDLEKFKPALREKIKQAMMKTASNNGLKLVIALSYGGQWDILQAIQKIANEASLKGSLNPYKISKENFEQHLQLQELPPPDFCIRTGGELRISNFLLWHLAYTELYFTEILRPDFNETEFKIACEAYKLRKRRYGELK